MRDADACLSWLAACPQAADGPVGTTGYCMGAGLALRTAGAYPSGSRPRPASTAPGWRPTPPTARTCSPGRVTAELYFGHADQDASLPPEQIERLDKAFTEAGVRHRSEVYTGAHHGYTMADTAAYDAKATERHWAALLDLFDRAL